MTPDDITQLLRAPTNNTTPEVSSFPPFSFGLGGMPADVRTWTQSATTDIADDGTVLQTTTFCDPNTGLEVRCVARRYIEYPAVDWLLYFRNTGDRDTPIIHDIMPLDMQIDSPGGDVTLHRLHGSTSTDTDFLPIDEILGHNTPIIVVPEGGRSSNGAFPFFNLEWNGGGIVGAIGWSGQWSLRVDKIDDQVSLQAGQQTTHLRLHPGEEIRTPRIVLVSWQGDDRFYGSNLLRRMMLEHYIPRIDGKPAIVPVTQNTWFVYNSGNETTEQNQIDAMPSMVAAGAEGYWLDAGWFEGGWPNGAGSWVPKPDAFPNGLQPVGDEAHRLGMKFVLWFEPERVTSNSRVANEHPEWVMHHSADGDWGRLFNLGNPQAARWLTDYLSECISAWGVDVYRNDFNIDPLPFWQAADTEDRQGMAEIRYIEGLYAMWDELIRRNPGLLIDNCASGGRRIDIEMMDRSIPFWQSDTQCCGKDMPVWNQVQNAGLSEYVPVHSAGVWAFDPYNFRSIATTGCSICTDIRDPDGLSQVRKMTDEAKSLRPYYFGNYYPLTAVNLDERHWCGWQYDRPDMSSGFVMCFRREQSPYPGLQVALRGLAPSNIYTVTNVDTGSKVTLTGAALAIGLTLEIGEQPGSAILIYEKTS